MSLSSDTPRSSLDRGSAIVPSLLVTVCEWALAESGSLSRYRSLREASSVVVDCCVDRYDPSGTAGQFNASNVSCIRFVRWEWFVCEGNRGQFSFSAELWRTVCEWRFAVADEHDISERQNATRTALTCDQVSEMATRLNLAELPNNLQEIKKKELLEENGSDVQVRRV